MLFKLFPKRLSLLKAFVFLYIFISFIVRLVLLFWNYSEVDKGIISLGRTFLTGFFFDIGTISFFAIPYLIYILLLPQKFTCTLVDIIITWTGLLLNIFIIFFSFFAEITFWDEFKRRFNFIAVDYLIYTNEVIKNINESYPLPILILSILGLIGISVFIILKLDFFKHTFNNQTTFKQKIIASLPWFIIALFFSLFITNNQADWSKNRYNNELSKAGIYSFFAAFRNNELSYTEFYKTININDAINEVKKDYINDIDSLKEDKKSIYRIVKNKDSIKYKPNVIFICIESLSAKYLNSFGFTKSITPNLDSLAEKSVFFTNIFATGTRTVRGMEAITLSIPPTPGRSIVKRNNNNQLFTIGEVFKNKGYERNFFYGGDGYFDNMNTYFGGNNFNIVDRGRGFLLDTDIKTKRINIEDDEVTFENAWGVCDEDVYNKVIKESDKAQLTGKPFFSFVMTTSNHRPFTYPENKVNIPSGSHRNGAIKYTDFAIGDFLKKAKTKPWYKNTVFVIMSDHCAYSAGRQELDVQNYHIPALIFNLPNHKIEKINKLCSQIDLFPTLFGYLHWEYKSNLFGQDISKTQPHQERAFIGNYRKLGLLKGNKLMVLGDQKKANFYNWNRQNNELQPIPIDNYFLKETVSYYQVADYLYNNNGLKLKTLNIE